MRRQGCLGASCSARWLPEFWLPGPRPRSPRTLCARCVKASALSTTSDYEVFNTRLVANNSLVKMQRFRQRPTTASRALGCRRRGPRTRLPSSRLCSTLTRRYLAKAAALITSPNDPSMPLSILWRRCLSPLARWWSVDAGGAGRRGRRRVAVRRGRAHQPAPRVFLQRQSILKKPCLNTPQIRVALSFLVF